jgi:hypothetical protein
VGWSGRAGVRLLSPSVESTAPRDHFEPLTRRFAAVSRLSIREGPMPRRNNPRSRRRPESPAKERIAGLGSHWRADGAPKTAYRNQGDALTAALVRRQESGVELNVYRCDVCSAWHMGNPEREVR